MSTDVEFRLTLTRDPQARAALRQWEADLLAAISRVEQARLRLGAQSIQSLHRMQLQLMNQQQTMQNQNQAAQQMALQRSLAAQAAMWRNHAAQIAALMRQANVAGLPPGGGGGGAGAGGGGGGTGIGAGGLLRGYLGYQGARAGANFLSESVQSYGNLESQQIQLGVLTGSKGAANDLLKELRLVGQAFGVTLQNLAASSKLMVGFGVDADDSADKLKRFAAITGGNADAMNRLGRAYGQVKGLGKLMAEETNQMIDAGFSPLIAIANRTGESIGEVRARMKDGGVSFDELREAIEAATDAGGKFAGMMEEMQGSVNASIGRMQSAWTEFQQSVGKWFVGNGGLGSGAGGATALAKTGSFIFSHDQEVFNSIEAMTGKSLVDRGYKSTDRVVGAFGSTINSLDKAVGGMFVSGYKDDQERTITETERQQIRVYELTKANAEAAAKVTDEAKKLKKERAEQIAAEESAKKALFVNGAQELVQAQKINDIRLKSAKDELKARKEILEDAKKATAEAQKSLMTAQERFGAMSNEEQNAAINDLLSARRNGVGGLSLEQINRIKSIGTKESDQIAGAALRNRAGAAFGLTNPEDAIAGRQDSIRQEIARLQNSNAARAPITSKARRDNDARINQLRFEASQFEGTAQRMRGEYQQQIGVRNSLFTQERRDVQMAERKQLAVEANVQQSIQFVAKFDQTAQQIATQVMDLFNVASQEQMKKVLKLINPIKKQVEAAQMRRQATAQQ